MAEDKEQGVTEYSDEPLPGRRGLESAIKSGATPLGTPSGAASRAAARADHWSMLGGVRAVPLPPSPPAACQPWWRCRAESPARLSYN